MKNLSLYNQSVEILINGKVVKNYGFEGKTFIQANEGSEYTIKLKNSGSCRVLAVISVDGLNVVDGSLATAKGTGYIIGGYSPLEVKGFRVSDDEVRAFLFGKKSESYAAKTDEKGSSEKNAGIIGVQFFSEKQKPVIKIPKRWRQPFERGVSLGIQEIFYASRKELIAMGVPIDSGKSISFPESFPAKYCRPPKS